MDLTLRALPGFVDGAPLIVSPGYLFLSVHLLLIPSALACVFALTAVFGLDALMLRMGKPELQGLLRPLFRGVPNRSMVPW